MIHIRSNPYAMFFTSNNKKVLFRNHDSLHYAPNLSIFGTNIIHPPSARAPVDESTVRDVDDRDFKERMVSSRFVGIVILGRCEGPLHRIYTPFWSPCRLVSFSTSLPPHVYTYIHANIIL